MVDVWWLVVVMVDGMGEVDVDERENKFGGREVLFYVVDEQGSKLRVQQEQQRRWR